MKENKITSKKIPAGKPGTKKMVEKYGDDLVCIRYRYDFNKGIRYKTVELIVERGLWDADRQSAKKNKEVDVKIFYEEVKLREAVKARGGIWNPERKTWKLSYKEAKNLGLRERIVK